VAPRAADRQQGLSAAWRRALPHITTFTAAKRFDCYTVLRCCTTTRLRERRHVWLADGFSGRQHSMPFSRHLLEQFLPFARTVSRTTSTPRRWDQ